MMVIRYGRVLLRILRAKSWFFMREGGKSRPRGYEELNGLVASRASSWHAVGKTRTLTSSSGPIRCALDMDSIHSI